MGTLKSGLIKLAYENPQLREKVLPILVVAANSQGGSISLMDQKAEKIFGSQVPKYNDILGTYGEPFEKELKQIKKDTQQAKNDRDSLQELEDFIDRQFDDGQVNEDDNGNPRKIMHMSDTLGSIKKVLRNEGWFSDIPKEYDNLKVSDAITKVKNGLYDLETKKRDTYKEREKLETTTFEGVSKDIKKDVESKYHQQLGEFLKKVDLSKVDKAQAGAFISKYAPEIKSTWDKKKQESKGTKDKAKEDRGTSVKEESKGTGKEKGGDRSVQMEKMITNPETKNKVKVKTLESKKDKTPAQKSILQKFWDSFKS